MLTSPGTPRAGALLFLAGATRYASTKAGPDPGILYSAGSSTPSAFGAHGAGRAGSDVSGVNASSASMNPRLLVGIGDQRSHQETAAGDVEARIDGVDLAVEAIAGKGVDLDAYDRP